MRIAINFNDQPAGSAIEVHDEPADWVLPAELVTTELPIAQPCPEFALCGRLRLT
jgi:hypothetical protein